MGRYESTIIGAVIITLFAFILIYWSSSLGVVYDKDTTKLVGGQLNYTGLNDTLESAQNTAETWKQLFTEQTDLFSFGGVVITGIFELAKTMWNFAIAPFVIILDMAQGVLDIPPTITGILIFMIIVTLIFALWRLIKVGF